MKFCDKLQKIRKESNLSQEQLAEKLKMSRQAISKWESGASYPDIATMIEICKVLNCTLNDLIDDDVMGNSDSQKNSKININEWINDLLKFITKTYNMFYSMKFLDKIKCLFEMGIIVLILFCFFAILGAIGSTVFYNLFGWVSYNFYNAIRHIIYPLYMIIAIIMSSIIFIHLFKIRYLDYFITVEDKNTNEKNIEQPIEEIKNIKQDKFGNLISEKKKEKIVIRDPKHSTYSFFSALGKIITLGLKLFVILISVIFICSFIAFVFGATYGLVLIKNGQLYFGIILVCLGSLTINYIVLEMIYNFLFNLKYYFRRYFIMFIAGLIFVGIGAAVFALALNQFNIEKYNQAMDTGESSQTIIKDIYYKDNLVMDFLNLNNVEIINDEQISDIKVEIKCLSTYECGLYSYNEYLNEVNYKIYKYSYYQDPLETYRIMLNGLKSKIIYNFDNVPEDNMTIKVYISKNNYDKILENNKNFYDNQSYIND